MPLSIHRPDGISSTSPSAKPHAATLGSHILAQPSTTPCRASVPLKKRTTWSMPPHTKPSGGPPLIEKPVLASCSKNTLTVKRGRKLSDIAVTRCAIAGLMAAQDPEPLHPWSRANVLRVGDAAHAPWPTSGHGACQALKDVWHQARCLKSPSGGLADVFQTFSEIRSPKTSRLAQQGRVFAHGSFATDPETCCICNGRAKASEPVRDVQILAAGWAQGLPMAGGDDSHPRKDAALPACTALNEMRSIPRGQSAMSPVTRATRPAEPCGRCRAPPAL